MNGIRQNAIPLFRFSGIQVSLHWSWFLVAAYEISGRPKTYSSVIWNVLEYVALFLIVILHEFGHALACRQVGGVANQIVLWPLGGVAYVNPPPRPGATLWSIAAGPLVNAVLVPVFMILGHLIRSFGLVQTIPNLFQLLRAVAYINVGLLIFNLLPIYPLDGGQILQSLLWFVMGRARSLMAASIVGFIGVIGMMVLAVRFQSVWVGLISAFILMNCWRGFRNARLLLRLTKLPSHGGFLCPSCKTAPPMGEYWRCSTCQKLFDTFQTQATCPHCATHFVTTGCLNCGRSNPMSQWAGTVNSPPGTQPISAL
jgi:Zn-dependent protease